MTALPQSLVGRHAAISLETAEGFEDALHIINATKRLDWPRLSCFGHNLHLGVTKSLADDLRCSRALGLCRKVVAAFSGSWKRKRELTKAQVNLNLKQHSLISVSHST